VNRPPYGMSISSDDANQVAGGAGTAFRDVLQYGLFQLLGL